MIKAPKEATNEAQQALTDVMMDKVQEITLSSGRMVKIGWLRPDTQDKINALFVDYEAMKKALDENDPQAMLKGNIETRRFYSKCVAAVLINNYFGLKLWWWAKWRIIHHFWHLNGDDFVKLVIEAKKKATEQPYSLAMVLLMTMPDTWTMMTKKEAEAYRQELESARQLQS